MHTVEYNIKTHFRTGKTTVWRCTTLCWNIKQKKLLAWEEGVYVFPRLVCVQDFVNHVYWITFKSIWRSMNLNQVFLALKSSFKSRLFPPQICKKNLSQRRLLFSVPRKITKKSMKSEQSFERKNVQKCRSNLVHKYVFSFTESRSDLNVIKWTWFTFEWTRTSLVFPRN